MSDSKMSPASTTSGVYRLVSFQELIYDNTEVTKTNLPNN